MTSIGIPYPTVPTDNICMALDAIGNTLEATGTYATATFFPQVGIPAVLAGRATKIASNFHCRSSSSWYEATWNSPLELAVDAINTISTLYMYYQRYFKTRNSLLKRPLKPKGDGQLNNLRQELSNMAPLQTKCSGATAKELARNRKSMNAANEARTILMSKIAALESQDKPTEQVTKAVYLSSKNWERLKAFSIAVSSTMVKLFNQKVIDNDFFNNFFKESSNSILRFAKTLELDLSHATSLNEVAAKADAQASSTIDRFHKLSIDVLARSWAAIQNPHKKLNSSAVFKVYHQHLREQYGINKTTISTENFFKETSSIHKFQVVMNALNKRLLLFKLLQIPSKALTFSLGFREGAKIENQLSSLRFELHQTMIAVHQLLLRLRRCEAAAFDIDGKPEFKKVPIVVKDLEKMHAFVLTTCVEFNDKLEFARQIKFKMDSLVAGSVKPPPLKSKAPHKADETKRIFPKLTQTLSPTLSDAKDALDEMGSKIGEKALQLSDGKYSLLFDDKSEDVAAH